MILSIACLQCHQVQGASGPEISYLFLVERMIEGRLPFPVFTIHHHLYWPLRSKLRQPEQTDSVIRLETVVVCNIAEGQRQHALLLQVALMDPSERLCDDGHSVQEPRLQGSMLTRRPFAIVVVCHDYPLLSSPLVVLSCLWNTAIFVGEDVSDAVDLFAFRVDRTDEGVVGDILQVPTVAEPRPCWCDVIRRALSFDLDQDRQINEICAIPGIERREPLDTLGVWRDQDLHVVTVRWRCGENMVCHGIATGREWRRLWCFKFEVPDCVYPGIKVEPAREGFDDDSLRRRQENTSGGIAIQPASEVPVERRDNRVWCALEYMLAIKIQ